MHPVIQTMTDVINMTDRLLVAANNDEWDGFDDALQQRQILLEAVKAPGAIEAAVKDGFGELAAELIAQITRQNERVFEMASQKRDAITQELLGLNNASKMKNAYKG